MSNMAALIQDTPFNFNERILFPRKIRYEILDGKISIVPASGTIHQAVVLKIATALLRHVEERKLGWIFQAPCDLRLSERFVLQPDMVFVGWKRKSIIRAMNLQGVPDLVVEVISHTTRDMDFRIKKKIYARYEIPEYWIVDPGDNSIEILVWSELGYMSVGKFHESDRLCTPLLRGLNLRLTSVFKNI